MQIVIFQVPEEFRDDCPDDHTLECSYDDNSERDVLEDSLSWLSWDGDKVSSLISFVCFLFFLAQSTIICDHSGSVGGRPPARPIEVVLKVKPFEVLFFIFFIIGARCRPGWSCTPR